MHLRYHLFITSLLLFFAVTHTSAQTNFWEPTGGPYGPTEWDQLFVAPDGTLYMYADTILVSTDNGVTWTGKSSNRYYLGTFLAVSSTEFYGGDFSGLYHSTDGGATWSTVNLGISPITVNVIFKAPSGNLFVGTNNHVFRSTNNGVNWTRHTDGIGSSGVYAFGVTSDGSVFAGTFSSVSRSTDGGSTWSVTSLPSIPFRAIAAGGTFVLVGSNNQGVFLSTDNGTTWSSVSTGLPDTVVRAVAMDGSGSLYVSLANHGPFKSTDNGSTWLSIASNMFYKYADEFGINGSNLYASTRAALFHSTDGGATWTARATSNFPLIGGRSVYFHSNGTLFAGTFAGLYRSMNNGDSWIPGHDELPPNIVVSFLELPNGTFLCGTYYGGLYSSSDAGLTWTFLAQQGKRVESLIRNNAGKIYHANDAGIYSSTDNGVTWSLDTAGMGTNYVYNVIDLNGTMFLSSNKGVYRSTDAGGSWTRILGTGNFFVSSQVGASLNGDIFASIGYSPNPDDKGLHRSNDNGDTWNKITAFPGRSFDRFSFNSLGRMYAMIRDTGTAMSSDNGNTWTMVADKIWPSTIKTNVTVNSFVFNTSGQLFAATSAGIYRSLNSTTVVEPISSITPESFALLQNYPNPFNPSTTFEFTVPVAGNTSLKISNLLGEEVAEILNEYLPTGAYRITWKADALPSGTYFVRMNADNFSYLKKVLLLK